MSPTNNTIAREASVGMTAALQIDAHEILPPPHLSSFAGECSSRRLEGRESIA
jgi:hypothetical protein